MTATRPAIAVSFDPERDRRPAPGGPRFDLRPASPAHLAVTGLVLWALGMLVPIIGWLAPLGVLCLLVAVIGQAIKPRSRTVYWRGRPIELEDETPRRRQIYRALFRS